MTERRVSTPQSRAETYTRIVGAWLDEQRRIVAEKARK